MPQRQLCAHTDTSSVNIVGTGPRGTKALESSVNIVGTGPRGTKALESSVNIVGSGPARGAVTAVGGHAEEIVLQLLENLGLAREGLVSGPYAPPADAGRRRLPHH
jgi:hypothetical protein